MNVGIIGAGTMGTGIAQVAATAGESVRIFDAFAEARDKSRASLQKIMARLVQKEKLTEEEAQGILSRIAFVDDLNALADSDLVIEAVVEKLDLKRELIRTLAPQLKPEAIFGSNTSSLSIAAISAASPNPERVVGIHFFNPAPLLPLVEIVPSMLTDPAVTQQARKCIDGWGKTTVVAKDTPGFIVNRVARPFYGEALRIYEEGMADFASIDWAMTELGGFKMGPFALMDLIGNDVNFAVTETVFREFFYDPRYRPSLTQKRLVEAGMLGRKSGRGFYQYGEQAANPEPNRDPQLGNEILERILTMLINEAADALFLRIATRDDIDLAMTKGVNYPKGLLLWADQWGIEIVRDRMQELQAEYGEDRYRPSPLLNRMSKHSQRFYPPTF